MLRVVLKLIAAVLVWVAVALLVSFVGTLLVSVGQAQISAVGNFLKGAAGVIGFLAGAWYFVMGPDVPYNRTRV